MKLKIFFGLLFFVATCSVNAQVVYDIIGQETCDCLKAKNIDFSKPENADSIELNVGLCMLTSYNKHKDEFPVGERFEMSDKESMKRLGEKVALGMVSNCPDFLMALGKNYVDDEETLETTQTLYIEGKVTAIETKEFVTIKIKDKNNRVHSFLLLEYFETASLFTENQIKNGTNLKIGYYEVELYDTVSKDFKYFKVISSLEKI